MPYDDQESKKPKLQANLPLRCRLGDDGVVSVRDENLRANLRATHHIFYGTVEFHSVIPFCSVADPFELELFESLLMYSLLLGV
jgi:hypothetical protein